MEKPVSKKTAAFFTVLSIVLSCLLLMFIIMSIARRQSSDEIVLTYAELNPLEGTVPGQMAVAFKEKTEELSGTFSSGMR